MKRRWFILLSALVVVSLILVGCQNQPTVEEIVDKMREVESSTEDAHGVVEFRMNALGEDEESVVEVWEKRPNRTRMEVLESSDAEFAGAIIVADGHQVSIYFPSENRVMIGKVGPDGPASPREVIQFMDEIIQKMLDTSEIELVGEEDVAGTPTYKLEFTPKDEEHVLPAGSKATVWVDQERWVALQAHFISDVVGEAWMSVRSFELNTGLADDLFHFEVPDGAEVVDVESRQPVPLTLDEAKAHVHNLLVPSYVPEGVTLINVFSVDEAIVLHYDHSTTSFTIMQGTSGTMEESPIGETTEVTVRGQEATLTTEEVLDTTILTWQEDGVTITIAGRISQDEILKVAESLQ